MGVKIKKGRSGLMDMTPMIDIVFQLMIFFLVATKLEESERELQVVLPPASEARPLTVKPKELYINIDRTGRFVVGGQAMSPAQLDAYLGSITGQSGAAQRVVIRADEASEHKFFATALNLCQKHNIRDFGVATADPGS